MLVSYPKVIVIDKESGLLYHVVGRSGDKYCLESQDVDKNGKKDKKAVNKKDPNDRYEPVGFYE